jgi:hypothetical protein
MILYAMESTWNSPARTRGTKRMSGQAALTQTEDGGYSQLGTEGDQAIEGGGAQTVQGDAGPKHGDTKEGDPTSESRGSRSDSRGARGRLRAR